MFCAQSVGHRPKNVPVLGLDDPAPPDDIVLPSSRAAGPSSPPLHVHVSRLLVHVPGVRHRAVRVHVRQDHSFRVSNAHLHGSGTIPPSGRLSTGGRFHHLSLLIIRRGRAQAGQLMVGGPLN